MSKSALYRLQGVINIMLSMFGFILVFAYFAIGEYVAYGEWMISCFGEDAAIVMLILVIFGLCYGGFILLLAPVFLSLVMGIVILPLANSRSKAPSVLNSIFIGLTAVTEFFWLFFTGNTFYRFVLFVSMLLCFGAMVFGIVIASKKQEKPISAVTYYPACSQQPPVPQQPYALPAPTTPAAPVQVQQPISWFGEIPEQPPVQTAMTKTSETNEPNAEN